MSRFVSWVSACAGLLAAGSAAAQAPVTDAQLARIQHILVIYAENRSFDHPSGLSPGANGIPNAAPEPTLQRDRDGSVLPFLTAFKGGKPFPPFGMCSNGPFRIDLPPPQRAEAT